MKVKVIISVLMLLLFIGISSATDIMDVGFNVSSEFKIVDDADGLQFIDEYNKVRIRIFDGDDIGKMASGFKPYNETTFIFNESNGGEPITDAKGNVMSSMPVTYIFAYGEYIKIDGKKYWVEASNEDYRNADYDKILESLDYFNEHNTFETIKVKDYLESTQWY